MLTALDYVENVAAEQLAEGPPARVGVVHGDYWPGNLLARASDLSDVGVVDVEHSCRAPLLVDVAHFADLAFRRGARTDRLELDLRLATAFAQAWADASGYPREELAALPRALVTARATCLLWIIERHVDRGPGPLDRVVSDDLRAIAFVRRSAARWSERLAGSGR